MMIPEQLISTLQAKDNIVLFTHVHPDGDALGSMFAMADMLGSMGKKVLCFLEEPVISLYRFMPQDYPSTTSLDEVKRFVSMAGNDVAAVALDCGDGDRLGQWCDALLNFEPFLVVDHHKGHRKYGNLRWVDPHRSSTGEMVYELAMELKLEVSPACAINLYVAISTDTGSFRYESTTARTLEIASQLIGCGVKPEVIAGHLHDNFTLQRLKLMELVLSSLQVYENGALAFIKVTSEMFDKSGANVTETEGFINYPRSLHTVKVAAFIKEVGEDQVSVSLRAKGECDVAEVAAFFGGGGHRNAAGFRFSEKSVDEVWDLVLERLRQEMGEGSGEVPPVSLESN